MNRNSVTGEFVVDIVSNLPRIFTAWREKMWVFLQEPQQTTGLEFVDQLKIKSSDHVTLFHVT